MKILEKHWKNIWIVPHPPFSHVSNLSHQRWLRGFERARWFFWKSRFKLSQNEIGLRAQLELKQILKAGSGLSSGSPKSVKIGSARAQGSGSCSRPLRWHLFILIFITFRPRHPPSPSRYHLYIQTFITPCLSPRHPFALPPICGWAQIFTKPKFLMVKLRQACDIEFLNLCDK